jgi:hypothetical protein
VHSDSITRVLSLLSQAVLYVRRAAPMVMRPFTVYIRWEASKWNIIRADGVRRAWVPYLERRMTFASWLTPFRGWYGRLCTASAQRWADRRYLKFFGSNLKSTAYTLTSRDWKFWIHEGDRDIRIIQYL